MCKYCENTPFKLTDFNEETMEPISKVTDNHFLSIYIPWKMEVKNYLSPIMCIGTTIEINYCPWCGRKLEEEYV